MIRGVSVGKFLPPHLGHSHMINTAKSQCDELTVLICDGPEYTIPVELRKQWLETMHSDVKFIVAKDILDDNDSKGWAAYTIKLLGFKPDKAFTSEDYGKDWVQYMGGEHVMVDHDRKTVPISATAIRNDPWANWQYLDKTVRGYFSRRIVVVGAESTGTTTLAQALSKHYKTAWVPEYGRTYTEKLESLEDYVWTTDDFVKIAKEQNKQEDLAAQNNKLLFCDTDSFATSIWHERYMGARSHGVEDLALGRRYDIYLLTDVNIPFVQDGIRDGEHLRRWMHERFKEKMYFWDKPFVVISGNPEQRLKQAIEVVDKITADPTLNIAGLERNHWHSKAAL